MADFAFIMLCVVLTKCSRSSLVEMAGVALYIATVSEKANAAVLYFSDNVGKK